MAEPGNSNKLNEAIYVDKLVVMFENFEQKFSELDLDKAKNENLLSTNSLAVDPGKLISA